jgi:alkylation response protein AidB-like acyl-CoA dehydrogenase
MDDTNEALTMISDQASRFLGEVVTPERLKGLLEEPGSFDHDLWRQVVELGWPAASVPEEVGGLGLGLEVLCRLSELMGAVAVSLPLMQNALTVSVLANSSEDFTTIIDSLVLTEAVSSLALFEPGSTGLTERPEIILNAHGVSGSTGFTPFAAVADIALIYAYDQVNDEPVLLLINLEQAAVTRTLATSIDNARGLAALAFDGAESAHVISGSHARQVATELLSMAAIATAFEQIGGARACLQDASDYARERIVFGQKIGAFQGIKFSLAQIYADIEIARGCALDALANVDPIKPSLLPYAAAARLAATAAYDVSAKENIQFHGGIGVTWESNQHLHYRRARALALELGSAAYWRDCLVNNLELMAEGF